MSCGDFIGSMNGHPYLNSLPSSSWRTTQAAGFCRRRYRRACDCRVPATVMAPGPPKAVGKGLLSNGFIAMLLTERFAAGRSMNSLVTGLGRQGAEISPATLAGTCAQAGALLVPLAEAITERSRGSWHLHADETTWRVFAPRAGRTGLQEFLETARIPRRYHDCEFENFAAYGPHQLSLQGAKTWAARFADEYPLNDRGLLLSEPFLDQRYDFLLPH